MANRAMRCRECPACVAEDCKTVWHEERITPAGNCRIARLLRACHRQRDRARGNEERWQHLYDMLKSERNAAIARAEQAERERDEARAKLETARDLAEDLRCYTHDWDWKYGEEWDADMAKIQTPRPGGEE